ncbi:beta-ketoacyl-ACP reductase [Lewinella cohaerens]|uniref:beta-ketoacyl-ACP reductase n=1 Tax=Lewinella cohaerens TaxID=70995 RepID=UPI00035DD0A7|nr:beta-ketoacyl-ACP reductase [Lewinella cohaerens]
MRLKDRVAIITGGAQGIGKATTLKFVQEGAKIAIWDINAEKGEAFAQELQNEGHTVHFFQVNTVDAAAVSATAKAVYEAFGQIDILINNAGITRDATLQKTTPEQWQQVLDVNLTGVFNCTQAIYPYMKEATYGRIVNASSVVGIQGNFGQSNYVATKAAVIGLTKVWAREFGRRGVTVNAVAPGFIATEMVNTIPESILDGFRAKTPLNRLGTPAEVANLYAFLASEEASFITGATYSVDGGVRI